ncbi:hypothetical protein [Pseudalkalibacillus caeni]|uniref:Lipoprotein n=1 Tax=Exobacillus caeni TaxID=2574798 RepID=A0A5R9F534_9BACL|nr:hypothetical protein [Pseudalkalibacillus caeni]TLS37456.1 hypothetical protein FCL54_09930 [Pseudalkalibacillus caeni]
MKKLLSITALCLLLFAAACNNGNGNATDESADNTTDNTEKTDNTGNEDNASEDKGANEEEVKGALLDFQMKLTDTINANDSAIYAFETAKTKEGEEAPSAEELAKMKTEAQDAANKVAEEVKGLEVPSELDAYKEKLSSALEDIAKAYESRAANLSDEPEAEYKEADDLFAAGEEKIGEVYEELGMAKPSLMKDLEG